MNRVISVVGLGYVGLPIAVEFAKKYEVIGYDINSKRISELKNNIDNTEEVTSAQLSEIVIEYTDTVEPLKKANFHIITVPTPINKAKQPDLSLVYKASIEIAGVLKAGDIVVYESTVYPGVTEEECIPLLEQHSGLKHGKDFKVGYSPERINPGDKEHTLTKITKVVSGCDSESLETISNIYGEIIEAGIYKAESIKVAEAAKVIENTQRDLNIAFVNELSLIFDRMNIDTKAVLQAAGTKWNFLKFYPGLVGGHCIGVDPYYLTHKAMTFGYHPQVILSGRRTNDNMGTYVAEKAIKMLNKRGIASKNTKVNILGLTFKENCPDVRNTRVVDIYNYLKEHNCDITIHDPYALPEDIEHVYGTAGTAWDELDSADLNILAVPHKALLDAFSTEYSKILKHSSVFIDVKGSVNISDEYKENIDYWRL